MAGTSKRSPPAEELDVDGTPVRLSNPDKVYFPRLGADGGTKRHLVEYYRTVATGAAPLLTALKDRPPTHLQRFPDGIEARRSIRSGFPRGIPTTSARVRSRSRRDGRPTCCASGRRRTSCGRPIWAR